MSSFFGGGGSSQPTVTTTQTTSELPDELKGPTSEVLGQAKELYEADKDKGFEAYTGPRIAEFDPATLQAQQGIENLVGSSQTYFQPALQAGTQATQTWPSNYQQYMSPYMQGVVDIAKREARKEGDIQRQNIGTQAVGAGAYGGSRQAILEAEQMRNEAQQLSDIQTRGLQDAYATGAEIFSKDQQRLAGLSGTLGQLGALGTQTSMSEQQALANVGQQRQGQAQRALDIDYQKFLQEREFPYTNLSRYADYVRGVSRGPNISTLKSGTTPAPSFVSNLASLGTAAAGFGELFGVFKKNGGYIADAVRRKEGGKIVKRQAGGGVMNKYFEGRRGLIDLLRSASEVDTEKLDDQERYAKASALFKAAQAFQQPSFMAGLGAAGDAISTGYGAAEGARRDAERAARIKDIEIQLMKNGVNKEEAQYQAQQIEKAENDKYRQEMLDLKRQETESEAAYRDRMAGAAETKANATGASTASDVAEAGLMEPLKEGDPRLAQAEVVAKSLNERSEEAGTPLDVDTGSDNLGLLAAEAVALQKMYAASGQSAPSFEDALNTIIQQRKTSGTLNTDEPFFRF